MTALAGTLHICVAFDWGDEIDMERARHLVPAETQLLPRRRRTPSSVGYRPSPLRIVLPSIAVKLPELGEVLAPAVATVFDFAAVSVRLQAPFLLSEASLLRLAAALADPNTVTRTVRAALEPLYRQLLPAVHDPLWTDDLSEEYFVFQFPPRAPLLPEELLEAEAAWTAGLLRLESGPLSDDEVGEALRLHLSYSPEDLFVPDWGAAVLLDAACEETLQTIEFANLQLLEYRHIDDRLDKRLADAYGLVQAASRRRVAFWRSHDRPLRALGELKVEANGLFERTGNVLKLVGDQYLARVYRLLATRFHLREWERSIQRKLEVVEGVYQVIADQAVNYRTEFLEIIVILLILLEIVLALVRH